MKAKNMKEWHRLVCERDGYVCQACRKDYSSGCYFNEEGVNQYVCGHHKDTQGSHPELKLETDIGECVDFECHTLIHKGFTKEQICQIKFKKNQKTRSAPAQKSSGNFQKKSKKFWGVTRPPVKLSKKNPEKNKLKKTKTTLFFDKKTGKLIKLK